MSERKLRPATPSGASRARGGTGRSESSPRMRPREVSQISSSADDPYQQPRSSRGRRGFARRPLIRGNAQSLRRDVQRVRGVARPREASVHQEPNQPPASPRGRGGRYSRTWGAERPPMRPRDISQVSVYVDATGPPGQVRGQSRGRSRQEGKDDLRPQERPGNVSGVSTQQPLRQSQFPPGPRPREVSTTSIYGSPSPLSRGAWRVHAPIHHFGERSEGLATSDKPKRTRQFYISELPISTLLLILLLWLPRFFIPWITTWHEFSVYILSNPSNLQDREKDLYCAKISVLAGKSIVSLVSSVLADCIKNRCDTKYYIYLLLLTVFAFSPVLGGFSTVALRSRFLEQEEFYDKNWFLSLALTEAAISFSFIMFPVQMACIYDLKNTMSRNAHYSVISLFVGIEFFNAYFAFLFIAGPCPTSQGTQLVVWNIIGVLLLMVLGVTVFVFFTVDVIKEVMMCRKKNSDVQESEADQGLNSPVDLNKKKLSWFVLLALPVIFAYFSLAVFEHFVPNDDWNDYYSSTLSVLLCGKVVGVIMMALVMYFVQRCFKSKASLNAEMFYLAIPQGLFILALVILVARLASMSYPTEGDIIHGLIPDKHKTVFVFINTMFRNRTVCVSSKHFEFKIRPYQLVTREVYDEVQSLDMTIEVDPRSSPAVKTSVNVDDIGIGEWKIFNVALLYINRQNSTKYHNLLYAYTLQDVGSVRPQKGSSQLVIFEVYPPARAELWYYQLNHSSLGSIQVPIPIENSASRVQGYNRTAIIWEVPASGKWVVQLWCKEYSKSEKAYAWATNSVQRVHPLEFELGNHSLYLLVEYFYEESVQFAFNWSFFDNPPSDRYQGFPLSWKLYKLAEVAGPNSKYVPRNKQLQKDWTVWMSMLFAGLAAGGFFAGFLYLFWVDPPIPRYRTTTLAVVWVLIGIAAGIPRLVSIDVDVTVSLALLILQIAMTVSHCVGSVFMFSPTKEFNQRP